MQLPNWIQPRAASLDDHREQLEHAREAHSAAQAAVSAAEQAFDNDGSAPTEKALLSALEAERAASLHVARAKRLLAEAERLKAEKERAALECHRAELEAQISARTEENRLADAEVAAWLAVADARLARRKQVEDRLALESELERVKLALGEKPRFSLSLPDREPSTIDIARRLETEREGLRFDDPRDAVLRDFASHLDPRNIRLMRDPPPPPWAVGGKQ